MSILLPDTTSGTPIESVMRQVAALRMDLDDLRRVQRQNSLQTVEGWNVAALASGWSNGTRFTGANTGEAVPGYFKDPSGVVHIRGTARNTAAPAGASTIFTLPTNYRPAFRQTVVVPYQINLAANASFGYIAIYGDGVVQATTTGGNIDDLLLDNIHFRAANALTGGD